MIKRQSCVRHNIHFTVKSCMIGILTMHETSEGSSSTTNPKPRGSHPEPLRCLALRTRVVACPRTIHTSKLYSLLTLCNKGESQVFEQERQHLEIFSVIFQNGLSKDTDKGSSELLPLYVALDQALHLLLQQLVHERNIVHETCIRAPSRKLQLL